MALVNRDGRASPSISVALATFNGATFLEEQLASIASQTRLPDEIVVGDDGSVDRTAELIAHFARAHPEIEVRFQVNSERLGSTANFEAIARRCCGEIVVFCDQDDVWLPVRLERTSAALRANPRALYLFSNACLIDSKGAAQRGTLFSSVLFDRQEQERFANGNGLDVLLRHNVVTGATLSVRRSALEALVPFERGWVHDYFIAFMLESIGHGVMIEEPLVRYRVHARQQVGVSDQWLRALIENARRQSSAFCLSEAENLRALRRRLASFDGLRHPAILDSLDQKAALALICASMRKQPLRAPGMMWREWRRGSYERYALGAKQAAVDAMAVAIELYRPGGGTDLARP